MSYVTWGLVALGALGVSFLLAVFIGTFIHAGSLDGESTPIDVEVER